MNLGIYQRDGVVNDLAPHDLSILLYWLEQPVSMVSASGSTVFQDGVPETAFLTLSFEQGVTANVQLSWLAPHKVRQMIVVGSKRMVVYDDAATDGAVRIYDRGFDFTEPSNFGEYQLTYRSGDMLVPRLEPPSRSAWSSPTSRTRSSRTTAPALARAARRGGREGPRGRAPVAHFLGSAGAARRARPGRREPAGRRRREQRPSAQCRPRPAA